MTPPTNAPTAINMPAITPNNFILESVVYKHEVSLCNQRTTTNICERTYRKRGLGCYRKTTLQLLLKLQTSFFSED